MPPTGPDTAAPIHPGPVKAGPVRAPWRLDAASLAAGLLYPLAFAPLALWPLAPLALALLMLGWWQAGPPRALWRGYLFGLGSFGTGIYWLHISFGYSHVALPVAIVLTALFVMFMALYPALAGYLGARLRRGPAWAWFLLSMPALWVLVEWLRGWFLSGFPWLQAGYTQSGGPAMPLAPVTGVLGLSLWVGLLAGALALLAVVRRAALRPLLVALPVALVLPWALTPFEFTAPAGPARDVVLVQGNVPQELKWQPAWRTPTLERYVELSAPHWGKPLIVWPETAIPAFEDEVQDFLERLREHAVTRGSELLIGLPVRVATSGVYHNSVIALGARPGRYDKRHLVPFGEFLPLVSLLGPIVDFLHIPLSSFTPGAPDQPPLYAAGDALAVSICYEGVLGGQVADDAKPSAVLVNVSNDAWFGTSIAAEQHLQMSRLRAAETGRYLLRATNTGISAIVDPKGLILQRSRRFETEVLSGTYRPMQGETPYMRFGDWPAILLCVVLLGAGWWVRQKSG